MCGIVGYIGKKQATPILLQGLRQLEYRGYDSAGIAIAADSGVQIIKQKGPIAALTADVNTITPTGTIGIAHTRWATHGEVTKENAHPHTVGNIVLVHNGIIENYRSLKQQLTQQGYAFVSQTDSEVLAALIDQKLEQTNSLQAAVILALKEVQGTYGLAVMHVDKPDEIVVARLGSPLAIGVGKDEYIIASDATPILRHTSSVIFLEDGDVATLKKQGYQIVNHEEIIQEKIPTTIDWDIETAEKQGFDHFMLKEIHDQPTVFMDAIRGRFTAEQGNALLGGLQLTPEQMQSINRIILLGCGTASHAGEMGKHLFERYARIPTTVEIASEFRYSDPIVDEHTLVFAISQSGETADTLAAMREAKRRGAHVRGIVNAIGSTIARESDGGTYIHAGPELSVASTKAFTNMIAVLLLYALQFGRQRHLTASFGKELLAAMQYLPKQIEEVLESSDHIRACAHHFSSSSQMFFIGRGIHAVTAKEASLKLKEITYIHSESYPGGEMKHGPISLLDEQFPVCAIVTDNELFEKMQSNVLEAKARKAPILVVATKGDERVRELSEQVIWVPKTLPELEPILVSVALQLFAYHTAVVLGRDVDRPRNLAKSVTVE